MSEPLHDLERAVRHQFAKRELLERALTHSSHARESETQSDTGPKPDNEQLEFLGDSLLGFVTSQELFHRFPNYDEGELSKLKAHLVSARHLVRAARTLEVGKYLRLGKGEEKSGGRAKNALLVDALEALLAALYLDAGFEVAKAFILREILDPELSALAEQGAQVLAVTDDKSRLLEIAQAHGRPQPSYVVVHEEGPEHRKTFTVEARIHGKVGNEPEFIGRGQGPTKKKAEQGAAREALLYLQSLSANNSGAK